MTPTIKRGVPHVGMQDYRPDPSMPTPLATVEGIGCTYHIWTENGPTASFVVTVDASGPMAAPRGTVLHVARFSMTPGPQTWDDKMTQIQAWAQAMGWIVARTTAELAMEITS